MGGPWRPTPLVIIRSDGPYGTATLAVTGEIDLSTVEALAVAARHAVTDPAVSRLVIDLAQVPFMDSTGIRVLVDTYRFAAGRGASVTVAHPTGIVARVLQITGVYDTLTATPAGDP